MHNNSLLMGGILIASLSFASAEAGSLYLAPSILLQNITSDDGNFRGLSPKLSLGYGSMLGQGFFLAGEVGAAIGTLEINNDEDVSDASLNTNQTYDLCVLPGMAFSENSIAYLRFGIVSSHFLESDEQATGGRIGLGIQVGISAQWFLRADYAYTKYSSTNALGSPSSDNVGIGAVYTFN